ncbi:MAG: Uncharacterized protein H6Q67_2283 [Firmicutes bacterium]|nr:Uncharacterized protein [Bacillota bacterium]
MHTTYGKLIWERRYQLIDDEMKEDHLRKIKNELDIKKIIKSEKKLYRKLKKNFTLLEPVNPQGVRVNVLETSEYIHYPVTKEDIIEVAKSLPVNVLAGVNSINLCLGKLYQEEEIEGACERSCDPYTGRIYSGDGPIYYPPILGVYRPTNNKIFLFAYVYDKQIVNIDIIEPFLRIKMLITFIHEVAHHDDNLRRSGRGHCFGINEDRCENYAEAQEVLWAKTAVMPYLKKTYQEEYDRLLTWIKKMGGVDISLEELTGEYNPRIGSMHRLGFTIFDAVDEMISSVINGKSNRDITLEFAKDLHYGDHYHECMISLEKILSEIPGDTEALGVKADTLIHLERYDEAEIVAKECLAIDSLNIDALQSLCDVQRERKNWTRLKQVSATGIQVLDGGKNIRFIEYNLIASLHLRDYKTACADVEALPTRKGRLEQKKLAFTALVAFVLKDLGKAVQIANEVLSQEKVVIPAKAILKAIINRSSNSDSNAFIFTENEENFLQWYGIDELIV